MFFNREVVLDIITPVDTFTIHGLRIQFDVKKTISSSQGNTATFTVFNPSLSVAQRIENARDTGKQIAVILNAGYKGNISQVYRGDITFVRIDRQLPNLKLMLQMETDKDKLSNASFSKTFKKGSSMADAFTEVANAAGLTVKEIAAEFGKSLFGKDATFNGLPKTVLDKLTRMGEMVWSSNDGNVIAVLKSPVGTPVSYKMGMKTGLVSTPVKTKTGVNFKHLLFPSLYPGAGIQLSSASLIKETSLRALTVSHKGDTHANDWYTEVETEYIK